MIDPNDPQEMLRLLHRYTVKLPGYFANDVVSYFSVRKYHLSMDAIADAYWKNNVEMPPDLFLIFEDLALKLGVLKDPEYSGVAELIARQRGKPPSSMP